jgi:hypothetical protein
VIATVDWDALLTVIWSSIVAGVGVTVAYGLAILGGTRAIELSRDGHTAEAVVYGLVGLVGLATILAAVVFGIVVLTDK